MLVSFERTPELHRETRQLCADLYNRQRLMFLQAHAPCLFVPIRSMQYLAVIDGEEIVFVDGMRPRLMAVSWQRFRPADRERLTEPVSYDAVIYQAEAMETEKRLQPAFAEALEELARKQPEAPHDGDIIPFQSASSEAPD